MKRPASAGKQKLSHETSSYLNELLKAKNLSLRVQQEVQDSIHAQSSDWVDKVNTGSSSYQAPRSQAASRLLSTHKPSHPQDVQSLPAFRPCIKTQNQIEQARGLQRQECYVSRPGINRQDEKDRLAAVFAFGKEGAAALQQASLMHNKAAATAVTSTTAAAASHQSRHHPL